MNRELVEKVANAVLYEGYMLYPYRPSAIKNRQRWTFGILYPQSYIEVAKGTERSRMQTECLLEGAGNASVEIELRFLHLMVRQMFRVAGGGAEAVPSLSIDDRLVESWDEGVERTVKVQIPMDKVVRVFEFRFEGSAKSEDVRDRDGRTVGTISHAQGEVCGKIFVWAKEIAHSLWKLHIDVCNGSSPSGDISDRNASLRHSLLSAHTILAVKGGEFISLLDPIENLKKEAGACVNIGSFPVLVGGEGERDTILCSPILLYDYPQVASESGGDFFDATEIDEMLTLRVMTLSDEEKNEMHVADERTRALLERTEQTASEQLTRTHATMRNLQT
jgi:hypothetical protein